MTTPGWSVERYKKIIDGAESTIDTLRAADRDRAAELADAVLDAQDAASAATRRAEHIRELAESRWQSATKALWNERWLTLKPFPDPAEDVGADLADIEAEIERAHHILVEGLDRPPLLRRRKQA